MGLFQGHPLAFAAALREVHSDMVKSICKATRVLQVHQDLLKRRGSSSSGLDGGGAGDGAAGTDAGCDGMLAPPACWTARAAYELTSQFIKHVQDTLLLVRERASRAAWFARCKGEGLRIIDAIRSSVCCIRTCTNCSRCPTSEL